MTWLYLYALGALLAGAWWALDLYRSGCGGDERLYAWVLGTLVWPVTCVALLSALLRSNPHERTRR